MSKGGFSRTISLSVVALAFTGCATTTVRPALPAPRAVPASPAIAALVRDIDAVLSQPMFERSYWGVLIKSLKTDETLYALNARRLMMPASTMKIVTLAAAAEQLGWDYRFETRLFAAGAVDGGTLQGDLVAAGGGDPSLVAEDGMSDRVFAEWADRLKQHGIRVVSGRVIGDDNAFEEETLGFGWMWDDLPTDDSAGVGALQYNENAVRVTVLPGPAIGDSAGISLSVGTSGLTIVNAVTTTGPGGG